jgi:indolepyruvate ferredoxin oxidoreductase beta subunit
MVSEGQADFLVVLEPTQVQPNAHVLKPGGVLIQPELIDPAALDNKRSLNVALLGALSAHLELAQEFWQAALEANLPQAAREVNARAFELGRGAASKLK